MISKLYGYTDTDDIYTPYHFKNCSKNGCVTKHYLGYTVELTEDTGYCGSCTVGAVFNSDFQINKVVFLPVTLRGELFADYPNNCCGVDVKLATHPNTPSEPKFIDIFTPEGGLITTKSSFDIQNSPTANCYELRNSINNKVELSSIITSAHSKTTLEDLAEKICKKPAHFDCAASSIAWMDSFPTTNLTSSLRSKLLPEKNIDNNLIASVELPDSDIPLDFSDHIYPYNYQVNCDYDITLKKETYSSELEIDLVIPDFIQATYTIPNKTIGISSLVPLALCIKNPIFGSAGTYLDYNDGICKVPPFPCTNYDGLLTNINPKIIWDYKLKKYKEPIGCCTGSPQENYCCNKDFLKKIEDQEEFDCFNITSEDRKFIGKRKNQDESSIDIHCNKNEITGQYYNFNPIIPVCVAEPDYLTINDYDVVLQGVCDAGPIPSGSSEYCEQILIDQDNTCLRLDLTYIERINSVPKKAVTLEFYYCEIIYRECSS